MSFAEQASARHTSGAVPGAQTPVGEIRRLAVVYRGVGAVPDAILQYSAMLTEALRDAGASAEVIVGADGGGWRLQDGRETPNLLAAVDGIDRLVLQYNPFSYGHWGFAPWLPRELRALRMRGTRIAVMVHEAFVHPVNQRQRVLRSWQRLQLKAILAQSDIVFTATEALAASVRGVSRRVDVRHLPVGSNLPDRRAAREATRARLGIPDDTLALVGFGTGHPSQLAAWVERSAAAIDRPAVVLNLGAGAPPLADLRGGRRVLSPGMLDEPELAAWLSAGDLFMAPFVDGVSTRRTTVMAALQHSLPVVATHGSNTDAILLRHGTAMRLVAPDASAEFERAVCELANDDAARRVLAHAGRRLFEEQFQWPVITRRLRDALDGNSPATRG
jgi:glycosyltransferase involved in cell wall biosynthesis